MLAHHYDAMVKPAILDMRAGNQQLPLQAGRFDRPAGCAGNSFDMGCIFS